MTNSESVRSVWTALESEAERRPGLYERRVFSHSGYAVHAGLVRPRMQLRLSISVPETVSTDGLERATKGFTVSRQYLAQEKQTRISVELTHSLFRELFEVVAEDIAARVVAAADDAAAVVAMRERLNHWERFMRAAGPAGLSREDQIGLFGELMFLRALLQTGTPPEIAVAWWKGPGSANQDFQAGSWALEVKATTGNSSTAVRISNELQLDDTDCQPLYLLHLWLREMEGSGTSLPQLVDEVGDLMTAAAEESFANQLVAAGYHEVHRPVYEGIGYAERHRRYYEVRDEFPRIRCRDLRPGVGKVEYGIELAGLEEYLREELSVIAPSAGTA